MAKQSMGLSVLGLGLAMAIWWGLAILLVGLMSWLWNWGTPFVDMMGTVYIGYNPTFIGTIIGTIWALIDGFIGGIVLAWFYNLFRR